MILEFLISCFGNILIKRDFVEDILEVSKGQDIFVKGKGNKSIFGAETFKRKVVATKIESRYIHTNKL